MTRATAAEEDGTPIDTTQKRNFSDYELKIVVSGPDRSHLSILDVPGIFQSLTGKLTELDKIGVDGVPIYGLEAKHHHVCTVYHSIDGVLIEAVVLRAVRTT